MPSSNACVYKHCLNVKNKNNDVTFHRFPKDPVTRQKWIERCCNDKVSTSSSMQLENLRICSNHFTPTDFKLYGNQGKRKIIPTAIPIDDLNINGVITGVETPPQHLNIVVQIQSPTPSDSRTDIVDVGSIEVGRVTNSLNRVPRSRRKGFKTITTSGVRHARIIQSLRKEIKLLRQTIRRLRANIEEKSVLTATGEALESLHSEQKDFFNMQVEHIKQKPWSNQEQQFSLSLFYVSPKAYSYLRDNKQFALPTVSLIRRWINDLKLTPGISSGVFDRLTTKTETMTDEERLCVIMWDEISIKQFLEYNPKSDLVEGFEDLGQLGRKNSIASYALVFMLRGLKYSWKQPVAFVTSHGNVRHDELQRLLFLVIDKVFSVGLVIKAAVCDQGSANRAVIASLGVSVEKPFFLRGCHTIFFGFDVPHLIKSIRNNLISKDFVIDGEKISWQVFCELFEVMHSSNCKAAPKLTERHIMPNSFQRMTVSLATQVFSASVAAALHTGLVTGELKHPACASTANFAKKLNDLFDCLNSRSPADSNPLKRAISSTQPQVENTLKNSLLWIEKWTVSHGNSPPCFAGLTMSINSTLQLWADMRSSGSYYLITSRLNQDPIENLFAILRSRGGDNNNPTAMTFRRNLQYSMTANLMKLSSGSNCEVDDSSALLSISKNKPRISDPVTAEASDFSTQIDAWVNQEPIIGNCIDGEVCIEDDNDNDNVIEESNEELDAYIDSEVTLEQCTMKYVAGYLLNKCLKKFECPDCRETLTKNNQNFEQTNELLIFWKAYKSKNNHELGNLKVPSEKFFNVTLTMYRVFFSAFTSQPHRICLKKYIEDCIHSTLSKQHAEYWLLEGQCRDHRNFIIELFVRVHIFNKLKWISHDLRDRCNLRKRGQQNSSRNKPHAKLMKVTHQ